VNLDGIQGEIIHDAPIGAQSWFRCGGAADMLFKPADEHDLSAFLKQIPPETKLTIIGGLANTIVRDGGVRGAVIQLGKNFANVKVMGDDALSAGAGALNGSVAAAAIKAGIGGLEFLSGIPGSLGGALFMNAGAYGTEMKDVLGEVKLMQRNGDIISVPRDELIMSYRHTDIADGDIVIGATLKGVAEDYDTVKARMNEIKARRNETQPIREKTGGSTFANPGAAELKRAGLPEDTKAWQLVEKVGGRGFSMGGAQISQKHCNFMINTGDATASDLENLGNEIRARVLAEFDIDLHWEIKRIGDF